MKSIMINLYGKRTHNNIHDETFGKIKQYPLKKLAKRRTPCVRLSALFIAITIEYYEHYFFL